VVELSCPVRGCHRPLARDARQLRCEAGHSHDLAKHGQVNLLQPQDKRSGDPGDRREAVLARRRTAERGLTRELVEMLGAVLEPQLGGSGRAAGSLLDVGAGDGFILAELAKRFSCDAWGVDISREAMELAARRHPELRWVIANGDRRLPFPDGAFNAVISVTGPKNGAEYRRLLAPGGVLVVAVSGPDDQAELLERVLGSLRPEERDLRIRELLAEHFAWRETREVRRIDDLDREALRDLLDGAYRGVRHAARQRFEGIESLRVTLSHRVVVFDPR
jgi:23S rRNA (guanine745-N1)-methyltransferase